MRDPGGPHDPQPARLLDGRMAPESLGRDRDLVLDRSDRRGTGRVRRRAGDGIIDLLVALLQGRRRPVSRPDARIPGGRRGLLADRRSVQPGRLLRAHGSCRLRPDRLQDRRARANPGSDQLRDLKQRRRLRDLHRNRTALRAHRCAEHGSNWQGTRRPPCRRAGDRGDGPAVHGVLDKGRHGPDALLASRRPCGRADARVRPVLRGDGRARRLRGRPAVLDDLRRGARTPRNPAARDPGGVRRRDGAVGGGDVLLPAPHQAAARVLDDQPRRDAPVRSRVTERERTRAAWRRMRSDMDSPRRRCSCSPESCCTALEAWTSSICTAVDEDCDSLARCSRSAGCCSPRCRSRRRSSASHYSTRRRSKRSYPWLPSVFVFASAFTGGAVLRVAGRVFLGWGPAPRTDEENPGQPREKRTRSAVPPDGPRR